MNLNKSIIYGRENIQDKINQVSQRISFLDDENNLEINQQVLKIIKDVQKNGLEAVLKYTHKFDKVSNDFDSKDLWIQTKGYFNKLNEEQKEAIQISIERITKYHQAINIENQTIKDEFGEFIIKNQAIDSVGLYIPGGTAPLLSSLIMTFVPAKVAKVNEIIVCSPPPVDEVILAVAECLCIEKILQIGGVQAIASLTFGLKEISLQPVHKIVGPGNQYVTLAKKHLFGKIGIDALYGPSELVIVSDGSVSASLISADLLTQLEHGSGMEFACLLTNNENFAQEVLSRFDKLMNEHIKATSIKQTWERHGFIAILDNIQDCIEMANELAPEHFELKVKDSEQYIQNIKHAGAVFLSGCNEVIGDYIAGPSHCLPTCNTARFSSGLSVHDFLKRTVFVNLKPNQELLAATVTLAKMEGLMAHAQAAQALKENQKYE